MVRSALRMILTAAVAVAAAGTAVAQEVTWKLHSVWVDARPEAQALRSWSELVSQKTGGRVKIDLYSGGSLGVKDVDMLRILPQNLIQAAGLYPGYLTRDVPELATTLPAGVIPETDGLLKISPELKKIYQGIYDKWGIKLLGFIYPPNRNTSIFCKEPINTLAGLKGKKVRAWEKNQIETFERLGVAAQIIPQGDLYIALKTGVVDCAIYSLSSAKSISLQEVTPNAAYLFPYILHPINILVSKRAWDGLKPDLQKAVQDAAQAVEKQTLDALFSGDYDEKVAAEMKAGGLRILAPFSDADRATFSKAAKDAWTALATAAGPKAIANRESILKALSH